MTEKQKSIDKQFNDPSKLTSKEFKTLQELSKTPDKLLKNLKLEELKDLKKKLKDEKEGYDSRKNVLDQSKIRVNGMIDKVVAKIDKIIAKKQSTEQPKKQSTEQPKKQPNEQPTEQPKKQPKVVEPTIEKSPETDKKTPETDKKTPETAKEAESKLKEYFKDKIEVKVGGKAFFMDKGTEEELIKKGYINEYGNILKEESLKNYINGHQKDFKTPQEVVKELQEKAGIIILTEDIDNYTNFVETLKRGETPSLKSPDMPDSDFEDGIFNSETFDKNLLNVINYKISDLKVKTDTGDKNIADIISLESITFENGEISISKEESDIKKKAKKLLNEAITSVLKQYNIPPENIETTFTIDKGGFFSSDSLKAIDAEGKKTDNLFDLIKTETTVKVDNGIIKGLNINNIKDDEMYKLQIGRKEEIMTGKALKQFIDSNKFNPGEQEREELDINTHKLAAEELGIANYITYLKATINVGLHHIDKVGDGKYKIDLDGGNNLTITKEGKKLHYKSSSGDINIINGREDHILSDIISINKLIQLCYKGDNVINSLGPNEEHHIYHANVIDYREENAVIADIEQAMAPIKNKTISADNIEYFVAKLEGALQGRGDNAKRLEYLEMIEKIEDNQINPETFDKKLSDEINDKISDLKVDTDSGDTNIANIIGGSIIFKNGEISTSTGSELQKKALSKLSKAINEILNKYGIDSSKVEIDFDNDGNVAYIKGNALDALAKKQDLVLKDVLLSGINKSDIKADKIYKVKINDKEKYLKGETLLDVLSAEKISEKVAKLFKS